MGNIIGTRPRADLQLITDVADKTVAQSKSSRQLDFMNIYKQKIWGINKLVNLSGSGKLLFNLIHMLILKTYQFTTHDTAKVNAY